MMSQCLDDICTSPSQCPDEHMYITKSQCLSFKLSPTSMSADSPDPVKWALFYWENPFRVYATPRKKWIPYLLSMTAVEHFGSGNSSALTFSAPQQIERFRQPFCIMAFDQPNVFDINGADRQWLVLITYWILTFQCLSLKFLEQSAIKSKIYFYKLPFFTEKCKIL